MNFSLPPRTLGLALAAALLATAGPAAHAADPTIPDDVLVRLRSTTALPGLLSDYGLSLASQFGQRPIYRLRVADGGTVADKVAALRLDPDVVAAEPNAVGQSPEARKNVVWAIGTEVEYATQWAPAAMRLTQAQALSRGAGVRVAVLDTGVDLAHPALAGKLLPGRDFVDGDNDPSERGTLADEGYGHGTHVAGLVALAAPDAKIVPLRVLDPAGQGNVWVLAEALLHAVDPDGNPATNDGAQVVNMSLGTLDRTAILDSILELSACSLADLNNPARAYTDPGYDGDKQRCTAYSGAVVIAAAGNGASRREKQYPAAEAVYGSVPMAATAEGGRIASFSNFGSWIDVAAPGDRVTSSIPGGGYATWSGTSMAAPLAAGTMALIRSRLPRLKAADAAKRLEKFGTPLCAGNIVQVNAEAAVRGVRPADPSCP